MKAQLPGDGARVGFGTVHFNVSTFDLPELAGGRTITVRYAAMRIGGKTATLPRQILVHSSDNRLMRSIDFLNFEEGDRNNFQSGLLEESSFSRQDREYRELLDKYWMKGKRDVSATDASRIMALIEHYRLLTPTRIGSKLRRCNIIMELYRILEAEDDFIECFHDYLNLLAENHLLETLFTGGQNAIDTLMIWRRYDQADHILNTWVEKICEIRDAELVIRCVDRAIKGGTLWTPAKLIEQYQHRVNDEGQKFELCALRAIALKQIASQMGDTKKAEGEILGSQLEWVSRSLDRDRAQAALRTNAEECEERFSRLEKPSEFQRVLLQSVRAAKMSRD